VTGRTCPRGTGLGAALLAAVLLVPAGTTRGAVSPGGKPPLRIVVAPLPGVDGFPERLVTDVTHHFERARFLSGRFGLSLLDGPVDPEGVAGESVDRAVRDAAGDATFLIWGRPGADGAVALTVVHLDSFEAATQSRQAAGRAPVTPTGHRLPAFRPDDPLKTLYALQGVAYVHLGRYEAALQVLSALNDFPDLTPRERYPVVFFIALCELALGLERGDAAQVDSALYHFGALNAVLGPEDNPALVGATRVNRGLAYQYHPTRRGTAVLDEAVASFEAALPYFPARAVPMLRARILHQLASAEQRYPPGKDGAHLHRAILAYRRALTVWTPDRFPEAYRAAVHNMAACFQRLPAGDREANLRTAIELYEKALAIPALAHRRDLTAATQGNLGQAWNALPPDPEGENLRRALTAYREAMRYWTAERNPGQYRRLNELAGQAYQALPGGDKREHLRQALRHYDRALSVLSRDDDAMGWALLQLKRGVVLASLPPPPDRLALGRAREAFEAALEVITPEQLPYLHAKVVQNLEQVNARLARLEGTPPPGGPGAP
jgi:tetratricopeptide (TPR) repeat protein